jgi:hypothetical protein
MNLAAEIAAATARNEQALASTIAVPKQECAEDAPRLLNQFAAWCKSKGVPAWPAAPCTIAAWVQAQDAAGIKPDVILRGVEALEAAHVNQPNWSNPIATPVVREELGRILQMQAPRSWPANDKTKFYSLPPEIQAVILRRDAQDTKVVRRLQNDLANLKKGIENGQVQEIE